ncbi:MAG: hypothetical protein ACLFP1_00735 [Candidatus Goldiibacteriota bacterium]
MDKTVKILAAAAVFAVFSAMTIENLPGSYYGWSKDTGGINYLPFAAKMLEDDHDTDVYIYADRDERSYEAGKRAAEYYEKLDPEGKHIVIWFSPPEKTGIIFTDKMTREKAGAKYVSRIEKDILNRLISRWYTSDKDVLAKVLGAFVYLLEKDTITKKKIKDNYAFIIPVDDPLYSISFLPGISGAVRLFFLEPITFIIFFPFVMHFIMVRTIGTISGHRFFKFMNFLWITLMITVLLAVLAKLKTLYPVYSGIVLLFSGFNIPVYMYFYLVYKDKLEAAAQSYFRETTGGFDYRNVFEGKKWKI